jgi:hypothetical protein
MRRSDKTDEDRTEKAILRIQKVYLVLAILGVVSALSNLFEQSSLQEIAEDFVFVIVYGTVYFALRRRKSWIIPLVMIISAFSCIWFLIVIFQPAVDVTMLLTKIVVGLLFFFFAYQINFFRKPEVRLFFRAKGHELF